MRTNYLDNSDYAIIFSLVGLFIIVNLSLSSAIPMVEITKKNKTYINTTIDQTIHYYFDKWINGSAGHIYPNESYSLNVYVNGTLNATTINASLDCSLIGGGVDGDYCTDTGGNNCSLTGSCIDIAYLNHVNDGNLTATNISADNLISGNITSDYLNSSNIDSNDIGTELLNVTHNITLGNNRISAGEEDLIIVLY